MQSSKVCPKCKESSEFYYEKSGKSSPYCKTCTKARNKEYKRSNPDKFDRYKEKSLRNYHQKAADPEYNRSRYRKRRDCQLNRRAESRLTVEGRAYQLFDSARTRANKKGIEFSITRGFIEQLFRSNGGRCSLTGIEFDFNPPSGTRYNPYSPSLDRIDNSKGYTPDNVRLVLTCVNIAFNQFGKEVFDRWIKHYKR